MVENSLS
jgi:hypothetical protein